MPAAPSRYLIVVPKTFPAAPFVERRRYFIVAPRPLPAAPLVVCRRNFIVVPRPLPAGPRHCRLYVHSGMVAIAAKYLRRARVVGRCFAATPAHLSTVDTPPAPAAQELGVGLPPAALPGAGL
jgi:hypothetical protein